MATNPLQPTLSEQASKLLNEVTRESGDGYTLMSRTGLNATDFEAAVTQLRAQGVIEVKGDTSANRLGEAYFYVPLPAQGKVDFLLGRFGNIRSRAW
jgi:hypothetical protein